MALDKLTIINNGGLSTTSDYRVGVLTATKFVGPIESDSATFTGNVSIGGTLSYEDVTNIDSVGVITARDGIDCNADLDVDGHTNLDNLSVAGVSTFAGNIILGNSIVHDGDTDTKIVFTDNTIDFQTAGASRIHVSSHVKLPDNAQIQLGNAGVNDFILLHDGTDNIINCGNNGDLLLRSATHKLQALNADNMIVGNTGGSVELYHNNTKRLETSSVGVSIPQDLDVDGHTNLDNVSVAGVTTSSRLDITSTTPIIQFNETDGNPDYRLFVEGGAFVIRDQTSVTERLRITSAGHIQLQGGIIYGDDNAVNVLKLQSTSGNNNHSRIEIGASQSSDNGGIHFYTAGSSAATRHMTLKGTSGYLGIGVDNPLSIIHAEGSESGTGYRFINTHTTSGFGVFIKGGGTTADRYALRVDDAAGNERFRINANGKIGVNNNNPTAKLDIVEATSIAAVKIKSGTSTNQNASLTFSNDNGGGLMHLGVFGSSATTYGANEANDGFISSTQQLSINSQNASGEIRFGVGVPPTERLRIKSNGQVIVGHESTYGGAKLSVIGDSTVALVDNADNFSRTNDAFALIHNKNTGNVESGLTILSSGSAGAVYNMYVKKTGSYAGDLIFRSRTGVSSSAERLRITSGGDVGISPGGITPTSGDMGTGSSQNTPLIHVKGSGTSATGGKYNLLARFEAGGDADETGAMIVLNHSNDRGLAIEGGRRTGNYAHGALKMIDNVGRVSEAMLIHGGAGQGVDHISFATGVSTTTTRRLLIDNQGNIKTGTIASALNFTDSNSGNTKSIEIGASGGGDALFVAHSSGYGVGYFGYEAGGDRLVIACDGGSGSNKIDFITDAGVSNGGGTDNLNGKSPKMRILANGMIGINKTTPLYMLDIEKSNSGGSSKQLIQRWMQGGQNTLELHMYGGNIDQTQFAAVNGEQTLSFLTGVDSGNVDYTETTLLMTRYRDLWNQGPSSGTRGGGLFIGRSADPNGNLCALRDSNRRPVVYLAGNYPEINLVHEVPTNTRHGGTIRFATYIQSTNAATGKQFVIGTNGSSNFLDIGYADAGQNVNVHNGIDNHSGTTLFRVDSANNAVKIAGHIIQVGYARHDPNQDTYTSINQDTKARSAAYLDFTPKYANSKLLIMTRMHTRMIAANGCSYGIDESTDSGSSWSVVSGMAQRNALDFFYKGDSVNHHYTGFCLIQVDASNTSSRRYSPWGQGWGGGTWEISYGHGEHSVTVYEIATTI